MAYIFRYLKLGALEEAPKAYSAVSRLIEGFVRWVFGRSPEKLMRSEDTDPAIQQEAAKDHCLHYCRQQRRHAVPVLASIIRDEKRDIELRHHAVETLALIAGRKLHKEPNPIASADGWLRRRGQ